MKEEDKKKKSYTKHVIIVAVAMMGSFFIASYIIGSDPAVAECFEIAEELEQIAKDNDGITSEVVTRYGEFLEECDFMIDMEEQIKSNPELHARLAQGGN